MTDNEIIKALECCIESANIGECLTLKCPLLGDYGCVISGHEEKLYEYALDLIKRQQAEIEQWKTLANEGKDKAELLEIEKSAMQHRIDEQQAEIDDLFYKLTGVMCSVDKWLEGDELKQDEVNRAATMREKTLRITEKQQEEIEKLTINMNAYGLGMIRIKERAENIVYRLVKRLKDRVVSKYEYTDTRIFKELDELVVEMEDEISDVVKGSKSTGLEKVEHSSLCETETFEGDVDNNG